MLDSNLSHWLDAEADAMDRGLRDAEDGDPPSIEGTGIGAGAAGLGAGRLTAARAAPVFAAFGAAFLAGFLAAERAGFLATDRFLAGFLDALGAAFFMARFCPM